jgi:hypothetical protein
VASSSSSVVAVTVLAAGLLVVPASPTTARSGTHLVADLFGWYVA